MSAASDFRDAMLAYAPLAALVGQKVSENAVDKGTTTPYVAFTDSPEVFGGLDGSVHCTKHTFRAQCWGATAEEAGQVADAVQAAVLVAGETVLGRESGFDDDTKLDAQIVVVEWWEGA